MDKAEMIRELRAEGYTVLSPEQLEAVEDEQRSWTCGCGTYGIEEALACIDDPREHVPPRPIDQGNFQAFIREFLGTHRTVESLHPTLRP